MADVRIAKPEAGESRDIASIPQANFIFDFATDDATISRDGDNLLIRFSDGSQVNLQNFYAEYNSENLPSFELEGERVEAKDFFAAMNEPDLMPAAGPGAASATVMRNARYSESSSSELGGGLEHLGGLDYGIEYDTNGMTGLASEAAGATTFPNAAANIVNEGQGAISTPILPPTIAITAIGDNGTINIARSENPFTTITGTVGGGARPGDVVTIRIPGSNNEYNAIVRDDLTWEVVVNTPDLIMGEEIEATITIRDENGNSITETITRPVDVDVTPPAASITINPVAGDDIIDASEAQAEFTTITGAVGGDVKPGDTITVTIEGSNTPYITTVKPDLTWEVEVPTKELVDGGEIEATVTTTDEAGNETTARDEREFEVVATPDTPDNPENPGKPDNPDTPDIPGNVDKPENPENPDEPDNPGVQDPVTTTATIVANNTTEGGDGNAQFTVSLSNPAAADATVIIEVNGQNYTGTIQAGQSSVTINVPHDNDEDVYIDPSTITATLVGIMGGDFEKLVIGENQSATSVIDDTIDTTTVKLAASEIVAEGKLITVTATVDNAPLDDLTITLESGETITIKAGETSGSIKVESRPDDAIVNGETSKTFAIKDVTGGDRYEKLVVDNTAVTTTIIDDVGDVDPENPDPDDPSMTVITLTATESVVEGGKITLTVTANHDIGNDPVTVKLSNGVEITIPAGEKSASITVDSKVDDYYVQGTEMLTTTIVGVSGGSDLENLTYSKEPATTTVTDDEDVTTITLSATPAAVEGENITVTATVNNAPLDDLTIILESGEIITIKAGDTSGSIKVESRPDDAIVNGETSKTFAIKDVTGGDRYEKLVVDNTAVTTTITDDVGDVDPENPDPDDPSMTVITLTATESVVEGGKITLTVTANHDIGNDPVTVKLSNGVEITIPAGGKSASITVDSRVDDYYVQGTETLTTTIVGVSGGSDLENLTYSKAPATTTVTDDKDVTTITLSATPAVVEGENITVTATVNNAPLDDLAITLESGETITIKAGDTSGSIKVESRPDDAIVNGETSKTFVIKDVIGGDRYENLAVDNTSVTTTITDDGKSVEPDDSNLTATTVSITPTNTTEDNEGKVTFEIQLSNRPDPDFKGDTIVQVKIGDKVHDVSVDKDGHGTLTVEHGNAEDVYVDPSKVVATVVGVTGGNFEKVDVTNSSATAIIDDTIDTTKAVLSVAPGGQPGLYTLTITLVDENGKHVEAPKDGVTFELDNDHSITIYPGESYASETFDYAPGLNKVSIAGVKSYTDANGDGHITGTETMPGFFEDLDFSNQSLVVPNWVSITAIDTKEGNDGEATFEIQLSNRPDPTFEGDTIVKVQIGNEIHDVLIDENGHGFLTVEHGNAEDVYVDPSNMTATVVGVSGSDNERFSYANAQATATIEDTIDTTKAVLSVAPGGQPGLYTLTITLVDENGKHVEAPKDGVTFELDNDHSITIYPGESYASETFDYAPGLNKVSIAGVKSYTDANGDGHITGMETMPGFFEDLDFSNQSLVVPNWVSITAIDTKEGNDGKATFEIQLSNRPDPTFEGDTIVKVQIGNEIHDVLIDKNGHGFLTVEHGNAEDVYVDPSKMTATVVGVSGADNEQFSYANAQATAIIDDTIDTTKAVLSVAPAPESGSYIFTINLVDDDGNAINSPGYVTFELSNGHSITIYPGISSASETFSHMPGVKEVSITGVKSYTDANADGHITGTETMPGFFEDLDFSNQKVIMTPNKVVINPTADEYFESDNGEVTFKITLDNPPVAGTGAIVAKVDITSDGNLVDTRVVTIGSDGTATFTVAHGNHEDVFIDPSKIVATVKEISGGNYANFDFSSASATASIQDTPTETLLTVDARHISEGSDGQVTFDFTLDHAPDPSWVGKTYIHVMVKSGNLKEYYDVVEIGPDGSGKLEVPFDNKEDPYVDPSTVTVEVVEEDGRVKIDGGNYEKVVCDANSKYVTTTITDSENITYVKMSVDANDQTYTITISLEDQFGNPVLVPDPDNGVNFIMDNGHDMTVFGSTASCEYKYTDTVPYGTVVKIASVKGAEDLNGDRQISYEESKPGFFEHLDFSGAEVTLETVKPDAKNHVDSQDMFFDAQYMVRIGTERENASQQMDAAAMVAYAATAPDAAIAPNDALLDKPVTAASDEQGLSYGNAHVGLNFESQENLLVNVDLPEEEQAVALQSGSHEVFSDAVTPHVLARETMTDDTAARNGAGAQDMENARVAENAPMDETGGSPDIGENTLETILGDDGNNMLFGGLGDDTIRGGAGDDYIAGGEGRDIMFGEDGNDIIYMDLSDYLVDGGNDIDFALLDANENNPTLAEMLANGMAATDEVNHDIPMVRDVEVLLTGEVSGIRNAEDLAERHIELGTDGDGNSIIRLGEGWKKAGSMTENDAAKTQTWENGSLTLETTLDVQAVHAALEDAASSLQANESIAIQSDIQLTPEYQNINDGNA